jgi:hypothetical protein
MDFVARQQDLDGAVTTANGYDSTKLGGTFVELLTRLMSQPHELVQAQSSSGRTTCGSGRAPRRG